MNAVRFVVGVFVAPWSVPASIVTREVIQARGSWPYHYELPWILIFSITVAYLALTVLGLPLTYLLHRLDMLVLPKLVLSGFLSGVTAIVVFAALFARLLDSPIHFNIDKDLVVVGGVFGVITATVFGLIAGIPFSKHSAMQRK